jgi:hypothetical protein
MGAVLVGGLLLVIAGNALQTVRSQRKLPWDQRYGTRGSYDLARLAGASSDRRVKTRFAVFYQLEKSLSGAKLTLAGSLAKHRWKFRGLAGMKVDLKDTPTPILGADIAATLKAGASHTFEWRKRTIYVLAAGRDTHYGLAEVEGEDSLVLAPISRLSAP